MDRSAALAGDVATWVKQAAEASGISLRSLAEATNIPWPTLTRRLAGATPFTVTELDRIARHLGTTPSAILAAVDGQAA
jgi:plasmid maintenance system antidote protein VapI